MILTNNKVYPWLIVFLLIGGGAVGFYMLQQSKTETKEDIADYQYQVNEPQLLNYSNGSRRWHIESETITQPKVKEEEPVKIILKNIQEGKLYSQQKLEYKVDADKIVYFEQDKDIELYGNVSLVEVNGDQIFSDFFAWHEAEKKLTTDVGVTVQMDDGKLTAQKMDLDLETEVIDFSGDVSMTFKVEGAVNDEK
ncbi:MAG: LPS export ABC transporter periplasmic protein LptC [Bacillota bacterium]